MAREKVAVITGSSTGIGFETSLTLAKNGYGTYATCVTQKVEDQSR